MTLLAVELYHGAALARIVRGNDGSVTLESDPGSRSGYVVNGSTGLYLKYSTNRLSPWPFSFNAGHQAEIYHLRQRTSSVFIALICGYDGIACLSGAEFDSCLDDDHRSMEWIRAMRGRNQKYSITGSDAMRPVKIGDNEYPAKVLSAG